MATTPKKRSKKSKVTRTTSRVESLSQLKKTLITQGRRSPREKTIATLDENFAGAEQQTATSEILRVIAVRRRIYKPVLDVVAENAARCVRPTMQ